MSDEHPLETLAEEFVERLRRGETPSVTEYIERRPDLADRIQDLFPTLALIEQCAVHVPKTIDAKSPPPAVPEAIGEFQIVREVGRGGMGIVYEAWQESLQRRVALKVLPASMTRDELPRERFHRESRAAARLHHTNIVPIFEVGEADGAPYLVMQLIEGTSLDRLQSELSRNHPATVNADGEQADVGSVTPRETDQRAPSTGTSVVEADRQETDSPSETLCRLYVNARDDYFLEVARIGLQSSSALAYAHNQGVIHRDIKPSNFLIDDNGIVWLTDFGLAKISGLGDLTETGNVVGTLRYLAPERFDGVVDARSDIFSLGLTLYELLTFRPAFDATDRAELLRQVTDCLIVPSRTANPRVPLDLDRIVMKCLDVESSSRYHSATELEDDLRRFLEGEPVLARPLSVWERGLRLVRRHPAWVLISALTLLVLLTGVGLFLRDRYSRELEATNRELGQSRDQLARTNDQLEKAVESEKSANAELDRVLYLNRLFLARRWVTEGKIERAIPILDECPERFRRWEWHYLRSRCRPEHPLLGRGGSEKFRLVEYSADGTTLYAASSTSIVIWDVEAGERLREIDFRSAKYMACDPRGEWLAVVGTETAITVWKTGEWDKPAFVLQPPRRSQSYRLAFHPTKPYLAVTGPRFEMWHLPSRKPVLTLPSQAHFFAFGPEEDQLATTTVGPVLSLWKLTFGDSVAVELVKRVSTPAPISDLAWGSKGILVTSHRTGEVYRWDPRSGRRLSRLQEANRASSTLAFDRSGERLAMKRLGSLRIRRVWPPTSDLTLTTQNASTRVTWSPDGQWIAGTLEGRVKIWEADPNQSVSKLSLGAGEVTDLQYSPDGRYLAAVSVGGLRVWEAQTNKLVLDSREGRGNSTRIAFSPDSRWLAAGSGANAVRVWDIATGERAHTIEGLRSWAVALGFLPDGKRLLVTLLDGESTVFEVATGKVVAKLPNAMSYFGSFAFSPDRKRVVLAAASFELKLFDSETLEPLANIPLGRGYTCLDVCFSPDGKRLATIGSNGVVRLWDLESRREVRSIEASSRSGNRVTFSPDGERIVSTDTSGRVVFWDVHSGQELLELKPTRSRTHLVARFDPTGTKLLVGGLGIDIFSPSSLDE